MKKLLVTLIAAGLVSTASAAGVHVEDGWAPSQRALQPFQMAALFLIFQKPAAPRAMKTMTGIFCF